MTRIAVIGNSHLACLREAWAGGAIRREGRATDFLGLHGDGLLDTVIEGGTLRAASDATAAQLVRLNGTDRLRLDGVAAVVVAGCMMAPATAARIWRDMRWWGLPSLHAAGDLADLEAAFVPRAAAAAALRAHLEASLALRLARRLVTAGVRVLVASQPRPCETVLDRPRPLALSARAAVMAGDGAHLSAFHEGVARATCAAAGALYVPQPEATRMRGMLTARPFTEGALRLAPRPGQRQPPEDAIHANARYGAVMLGAIWAAVEGRQTA